MAFPVEAHLCCPMGQSNILQRTCQKFLDWGAVAGSGMSLSGMCELVVD